LLTLFAELNGILLASFEVKVDKNVWLTFRGHSIEYHLLRTIWKTNTS